MPAATVAIRMELHRVTLAETSCRTTNPFQILPAQFHQAIEHLQSITLSNLTANRCVQRLNGINQQTEKQRFQYI